MPSMLAMLRSLELRNCIGGQVIEQHEVQLFRHGVIWANGVVRRLVLLTELVFRNHQSLGDVRSFGNLEVGPATCTEDARPVEQRRALSDS